MIFFSETMTDKLIYEILENESVEICNKQKLFFSQKETLLLYMQKITNSIEKIENIDNTEKLLEILSKLKFFLDKIHSFDSLFVQNIDTLKSLSPLDNCLSVKINNYNISINNLTKDWYIFTIELENFIKNVLNNVEFLFLTSTIVENTNINQNSIAEVHNNQSETNSEPKIEKEAVVENKTESKTNADMEICIKTDSNISSEKEIVDNNCLLISEKQNKVFLPYKLKNLEQQFVNSHNKYANLNELIEKEYIVSLDRFKNPILSRFKEAFHLMKNKESSTFIEALDLALELSFNSTLNPAIIAACANKNELDIYLDCLYEQELEQFKIFEIKYEINPI